MAQLPPSLLGMRTNGRTRRELKTQSDMSSLDTAEGNSLQDIMREYQIPADSIFYLRYSGLE